MKARHQIDNMIKGFNNIGLEDKLYGQLSDSVKVSVLDNLIGVLWNVVRPDLWSTIWEGIENDTY